MSERQLRRRRKKLRYEEEVLMAQLFTDSESPKGIEHFEDVYLGHGASLEEVKRHLRGMWQFTRAEKSHIIKHYAVKLEIKRTNKKLWRLR